MQRAYTYGIQLSIHFPEGDNFSCNITFSNAPLPSLVDLQRAVSLWLYFPNKRSTSLRGCDERRRLIFAREVGCLAADRSASFVFTLRVKPVAPCIKPDNPHAEDPKPHKHRYVALRLPPSSLDPEITDTYIYHLPVQLPLEINPYRIRAHSFPVQANEIDPLSNFK